MPSVRQYTLVILSVLGWPRKAGSQSSVGVTIVLTMLGYWGSEVAIVRLKYFCTSVGTSVGKRRCVVTRGVMDVTSNRNLDANL